MFRLFNYLGEKKILIDAPQEYLTRIEKNIDEPVITSSKEVYADLKIEVISGSPVRIVKNKEYPFARTSLDESRPLPAIDFFRYKEKVMTILIPRENEFVVESYIPKDESGVTRIIKKWYFSQDSSRNKALFHSSLVSFGSEGILIPGNSFAGKTSLLLWFLENLSSNLVMDEHTLVEKTKEGLTGFYLPVPIHLRLKSVYDTKGLSRILDDYSIVEATQNIDEDYIEKLIKSGKLDLDASVDIARKNFASFLGVRTRSKCRITRIVFPEYSKDDAPRIERMDPYKAFSILREVEIAKNPDMGRLKKAYEKEEMQEALTHEDWIEGIPCFKLSFSDYKKLNKTVIEDLLS